MQEIVKKGKKGSSIARCQTQTADKKLLQWATTIDKLEPSMIQTAQEIKTLEKKVVQDEKQLAQKQSKQRSKYPNFGFQSGRTRTTDSRLSRMSTTSQRRIKTRKLECSHPR